MDPRVKLVLSEHGINSINSEKFRYDNHEDDNRIIFDFDYILCHPDNRNFPSIVGYSEHPAYNEREDCVAVMFEDSEGEYWCHVPGNYFTPFMIGYRFDKEDLMEDTRDYEETRNDS